MSISKPSIVSRASWGAEGLRSTPASLSKSAVNYLIIHHTDTPNGETGQKAYDRVKSIQNYHRNETDDRKTEKWCDIGYHYLISADGVIFEGRKACYMGAHVAGMNNESLGISLLGTFNATYITSAQEKSLVKLLAWLGQEFDVHFSNIKGHRDFETGNDCPGDKVYNNLPTIRNKVSNGDDGGDTGTGETTYFRVVAGSFRNRYNAVERQDILAQKSYSSFLAYENGYYRVIAGSYTVRSNAEDLKNELISKGMDAFLLVFKK